MLQITLVMEDKVSLDELQEQIQEAGEEYVQSTDVAGMSPLADVKNFAVQLADIYISAMQKL